MKKSTFRYKNIFIYASLQFCGNIEEYFARYTERLVVFIVMPRLKNKNNLVRLYEKGKLVEEKNVQLSENLFLYYFLWYVEYLKIINRYFSNKDKNTVINFHPISFFGMSIQKQLKNLEFVYWVGDYFPLNSLPLRLYEGVKKFYHDKVRYACYLGDGINKEMNSKVLDTQERKTVMWGVKPKHLKRNVKNTQFSILFVGVIKESQGLEEVFLFLKNNKSYSLQLIGICNDEIYRKFSKLITDYKVQKQVYFPNKFFLDQEVDKISKNCHIGIAMYDVDEKNPTYYTDPGKVKAYIEMGLPVLMSKVSAVAPYIKKFNAGEVIERENNAIAKALTKIQKNYNKYIDGVDKFTEYFYYEDYYKEKFRFLEKI